MKMHRVCLVVCLAGLINIGRAQSVPAPGAGPVQNQAPRVVPTCTTGKTVQVVASHLPLQRVAATISDQVGFPVIAMGKASDLKVTLIYPRKTELNALLRQLTATHLELLVVPKPDAIEIWDRAEYQVKGSWPHQVSETTSTL